MSCLVTTFSYAWSIGRWKTRRRARLILHVLGIAGQQERLRFIDRTGVGKAAVAGTGRLPNGTGAGLYGAWPHPNGYPITVVASNKMLPITGGNRGGGRISKMARRGILATLRDRYRSSFKKDKGRILDEFMAISGHHRKHGVRLRSQLDDDGEVQARHEAGASTMRPSERR